jgi:hypothetical protein
MRESEAKLKLMLLGFEQTHKPWVYMLDNIYVKVYKFPSTATDKRISSIHLMYRLNFEAHDPVEAFEQLPAFMEKYI